jgi:L-rhamnose isomerase
LAWIFFDASINRIGAWTIGARATLKSLLIAFLEPTKKLKEYEGKGDNFFRLALLEELKTMPFGFIWDYYCQKMNVPVETEIINDIHKYGNKIMSERG